MAERFTADEVRKFLAEECEEAGGQKMWAEQHGVSPAYVCDVLQGRRDIGVSIASALGFRRVILFESP